VDDPDEKHWKSSKYTPKHATADDVDLEYLAKNTEKYVGAI
jgi:hypothetical protein